MAPPALPAQVPAAMDAPDPFPPLDTPRLRLRLAAPADAAPISALMTQGISRWLGNWPMPYTPDMAAGRIRDWGALARAGRGMPCAITLREGGAAIGWIYCMRFRDPPVGTLGYWCGEAHQNRGYVREAAAALVPAAFRHLGLDAIEALAQPANAGSRAVLRGLGMREVGEEMDLAPARGREELVLRHRLDRPAP